MSPSSREPGVLAYWRERVPSTLFVPLALFLALPSLAEGWSALGKSALVAYLLVFQFRLWDDLSDRNSDSLRFPERVLPRATTLAPFHALFAVLTVALVFLLRARTVFYLVALVVFFPWSRWLAARVPAVGRYHVTLLKYPIFAFLASGASPLAMALVYFTLVVYEPLHDPRVRSAPVMAADLLGWLLVLVGISRSLIVLPAAALAAFAVERVHRGEDGTLAGRALFLVSFACLLLTEGAFW